MAVLLPQLADSVVPDVGVRNHAVSCLARELPHLVDGVSDERKHGIASRPAILLKSRFRNRLLWPLGICKIILDDDTPVGEPHRREEVREGLRPEVLCLERVCKTIVSMNLAAPEVNAVLPGFGTVTLKAFVTPMASR